MFLRHLHSLSRYVLLCNTGSKTKTCRTKSISKGFLDSPCGFYFVCYPCFVSCLLDKLVSKGCSFLSQLWKTVVEFISDCLNLLEESGPSSCTIQFGICPANGLGILMELVKFICRQIVYL